MTRREGFHALARAEWPAPGVRAQQSNEAKENGMAGV
jgi:hypothetical protein